jgi:hypothetical protein
MPILDPAFRGGLRAKRVKTQTKGVADHDTLERDAAVNASADRPVRHEPITLPETGFLGTEELPPAGLNGGNPAQPDMGNPITQGDDPDVLVHPNDSGPRLLIALKESSVDEIYTLPAAQAEQITGRNHHTTNQSKAPKSSPIATAAAVAPAPPDLLDPLVLRTMPPQVAAFMLYEPPEPLRWQTSRPPEAMDEGSWCG